MATTNPDGTKPMLDIPKQIIGYRNLTEKDVHKINTIKELSERVGALVEQLAFDGKVDTRWVMIAKTDLQKGFMALTRAVAQPTTF